MLDIQLNTVEDLEESLQKALDNIDKIALKVADKQLDVYDGFVMSEKYKDEVINIGNKLKEKGIDITTMAE